ncbi:hypothetical protein KO465_02610 [Candidatus Micrarchaeota archaeon]|nr:hypothetical protein [Candidatus Micrarchaeota archaeon]
MGGKFSFRIKPKIENLDVEGIRRKYPDETRFIEDTFGKPLPEDLKMEIRDNFFIKTFGVVGKYCPSSEIIILDTTVLEVYSLMKKSGSYNGIVIHEITHAMDHDENNNIMKWVDRKNREIKNRLHLTKERFRHATITEGRSKIMQTRSEKNALYSFLADSLQSIHGCILGCTAAWLYPFNNMQFHDIKKALIISTLFIVPFSLKILPYSLGKRLLKKVNKHYKDLKTTMEKAVEVPTIKEILFPRFYVKRLQEKEKNLELETAQ